MSKYAEPIANMGVRPTNLTLHGRSVHRSIDVPGHNVFKGYTTWANNGHLGVGDAVDLAGAGGDEVYAHINAAKEGVNLPVGKGERVGKLRGDLSSPHLHFELWLGGQAVQASAHHTGRSRGPVRLNFLPRAWSTVGRA